MAIAKKILGCTLIITAMMLSQSYASKQSPIRLTAGASRNIVKKAMTSAQVKQQPTKKIEDPNSGGSVKSLSKTIPSPNEVSILDISEGKSIGTVKFKEYKFDLSGTHDNPTIIGVYKSGQPITYTRQIHEQLYSSMSPQLQGIIEANLLDEILDN